MTSCCSTSRSVDDNALNRDVLARRLTRLGYTVVTAEHGQQALEMLRAAPYDLVLLDIPICGRQRAQPRRARPPPDAAGLHGGDRRARAAGAGDAARGAL